MKHFALIGATLTHSYSKRLFDNQHFPDADYSLWPMASLQGLRAWVADFGINGFNVTNPHKQTILPLLDHVDEVAKAIGAVNCVVVEPDGTLVGHNTDAPAFLHTLDGWLSASHPPTRGFILGTGGAAQAVKWALQQVHIPGILISRHPECHPDAIGYDTFDPLLAQHDTLIVNATPVGTWPDVDRSPLPPLQPSRHILYIYDLVYNPSPTLLLQQAAAIGAHTHDGLSMLTLQAELSWRFWNLR